MLYGHSLGAGLLALLLTTATASWVDVDHTLRDTLLLVRQPPCMQPVSARAGKRSPRGE
jgi:hypothetical protein